MLLVIALLGHLWVIDHDLTPEDCRAEMKAVPFSRCIHS